MVCSSAAKRSTSNQYVCKYIGRINDQSNWSGPFSLVVMTLDYRSRGTWFDPRSGHSTGIFSLQVYFSYYYMYKSTCQTKIYLPKKLSFFLFLKNIIICCGYQCASNEYHNICFL